jgi:L-amino acid N-acyltransferase YncA
MIHKLETGEYVMAQRVLAPLNIHLAVTALLEGSSPGEIYVDDSSDPKSVFAWTMHRFFLAGEDNNHEFNEEVKTFFSERIYPEWREKGLEGFTLYFASESWGDVIKDVILRDKHPVGDTRQYYEFKDLNHDWREMLPEGFSLLPVDKDLLANEHLKNLEDLVEEMKSERPSAEAFLENSFGFCIVPGSELAAWCLSEYNSAKRCEVGIETQEEYRRRGLATITTSALVEAAQMKGITQIGWHCYAGNQASIATALKVGFEKVLDYPSVWAVFDETINLAVNGNACFERQDFGGAVEWYEQAILHGDPPVWVYWNAACAYAHLDDIEPSFRFLNQAVDKGFADAEFLKKSRHFVHWHDRQEWSELIDRFEE